MKYTDTIVYPHEKRLFDAIFPCFESKMDVKENPHFGLVYHCCVADFQRCVMEDIVSRKICEIKGGNLVSVQFAGYRKTIEELDRSFGFDPLFIEWESAITETERNIISETMDKFLEAAASKRAFQNLTYRGIRYGEILYGTLLREAIISPDEGQIVFSKDIVNKFELAIRAIDRAYEIFSKYECSYMISCASAYLNMLFARVGQEFGVEIFAMDFSSPKMIAHITPDRKLFDEIKMQDFMKSRGDSDLKIEKIDEDLFVDKRMDWEKPLWLRNGKPNVFILTHALTDDVRTGVYMDLFYDYYEWLTFTLNVIKDMKHVNWYLKDHPYSRAYNQQRVVRELFEKYSGTNLFWCDKNVSGGQLVSMADCVVTCAGDAGIEFWAYGIPTISAAKAFYVDWGISYNPDTKEDYVKLLASVDRLEKPSAESVENAKKKLMQVYHCNNDIDGLQTIFLETYKKRQILARRGAGSRLYEHYEFAENLRNAWIGFAYDSFKLKIFDVL